MRAIHFDGKQARFMSAAPPPEPRLDEAVIRTTRAGVCATDLEICRGYMGFSGVLGHEFVGVVESVHPKTGDPGKRWIGRRVVGSINCVCGVCDLCRAGLGAHCRQRTVLGIAGRDGCFADRFTLPLRNLHHVPDAVDDDTAVFAEPLAAACQVARQIPVAGRQLITVLGSGRLGLLVAQVLSKEHPQVRVVGRNPGKLALCERWGIRHRLLGETTQRADQDVVVECTGSPGGLAVAMGMVRPRGLIVMKTTTAGAVGMNLSPLVVNEIRLVGSRCGPLPEALRRLTGEEVDVLSLISRRVRIEDGAQALQAAARPDVIKVLVEF